jgi:hypothetical protein
MSKTIILINEVKTVEVLHTFEINERSLLKCTISFATN